MDRVELAFRKFDLNHDGFLSREEFDMVSSKIESPSERDSFLHGIWLVFFKCLWDLRESQLHSLDTAFFFDLLSQSAKGKERKLP